MLKHQRPICRTVHAANPLLSFEAQSVMTWRGVAYLAGVDHRASLAVAVMQEARVAGPRRLGRTTGRASSCNAPGRTSKNETVLNVGNRLADGLSYAPAEPARNRRLGAPRDEVPTLDYSGGESHP